MNHPAQLVEGLRRALRGAGWAGLAGVGLLLLATAVDLVGGAANEARREELAAERERLLGAAGGNGAPALDDRARFDAFLAQFPPARELPGVLTSVQSHADNHGLVIERTEYRPVDDAGLPLQRVLVSLPVQGEFAALAGWLGEMLAAMPSVALQSLSVRRSDPAVLVVDGEVRLQVYLRRRP